MQYFETFYNLCVVTFKNISILFQISSPQLKLYPNLFKVRVWIIRFLADKHPNISYRLPFHIKEYKLFPGYYWDVKEIRIHKDKTLSIEDRFGKVHTPNSVKWSLAKAHAQAQLTFFAPGLAHNHVHFVFPTLMASLVRQVLPEDSILRKLVEPHTRFTQYINYKALNVSGLICKQHLSWQVYTNFQLSIIL